MSLLLVLPYCPADANQALRLLGWLQELGGCRHNKALLVADIKVPKQVQQQMNEKAQQVFQSFHAITTPHNLPNEAWPVGPNWMFETALRHIGSRKLGAFLWLEPDCVPMRAS